MAGGPTTTAPRPADSEPHGGRRGIAAEPDGAGRSAAGDAIVFTGATYVAQVFVFLAGLLQRGLLGPTNAGYWALMQSFWTYLTVAPLGTMNASGRQVPAYRGKRDYAAAASVADTGGTFSVLAVGVAGVVVATVTLVFGQGWPDELRYGLLILCALGPLRMVGDVHKSLLQAVKRWDASSATTVLEAVTLVVVQTLCVVFLGFYGMFLGIAISLVVLYAFWWRIGVLQGARPAFVWELDRKRIPELISFGFPLMLQGQLWLLFMSIDNLIVAGFISVRDLGYYALAVSVTNYVLHLPRSIGASLLPRMTEEFIQTEDMGSIRHYAVDVQRLLAYMLVPVFLGAAFYLVPVLIRHGLPEFEPAIPVVRIMVAASFLIALVSMPTKVLTTAGYRWGITALTVACLVINAVANYVAVAVLDAGLEGAAVATAASYLVAMVTLTGYAMLKVGGWREAVRQVTELLLVFAYVIAAAWGVEGLVGSSAESVVGDALEGLGKLALFLLAISPLLLVAERRHGAGARLAGIARKAAGRLRS